MILHPKPIWSESRFNFIEGTSEKSQSIGEFSNEIKSYRIESI